MRAALAIAALLAVPGHAFAFDLEHDAAGQAIRWPAGLTLYVDGHARNLADADILAAAQRAADHWSAAAAVTVTLASEDQHGAPGYDPSRTDNRSEVIFMDSDWEYDDGVLATTLVTSDSDTHEILDADILVNGSQHHFAILPDGSQAGQGLTDDLEATLTHELGHALGLAHNTSLTEATMYPSTLPGEITKRHLDADDIQGVQQLYGSPSAPKSGETPSTGCSTGIGGDGLLALFAVLGFFRRGRAAAAAALVAAAIFPGLARAESRAAIVQDLDGEVRTTHASWQGGRIYTDVEVAVSTCRAGSCGAHTTYRVPGGTVGHISQQLSDVHVPSAGERVSVQLVRGRDGGLRQLLRAR